MIQIVEGVFCVFVAAFLINQLWSIFHFVSYQIAESWLITRMDFCRVTFADEQNRTEQNLLS